MRKTIIRIVQIIWVTTAILFCTAVGAVYGLQTYGIGGAIGCGMLGLVVGCVIAAGPQFWLGMLT